MSQSLIRNPNPDSMPGDGSPVDGQTMMPADANSTSLDPDELIGRIQGWWRVNRDHWHSFHQEATTCFDFRAGNQWSDEDKQILADQSRPAITFNRIGPFVDAVHGLEINNRQDTVILPRQLGSAPKSEILTSAVSWARQECDAEDEESEAFLDAVTCGLGCTQSRMDYDDNPDGDARIERIDPREMFPDAAARKQNLTDARNVLRAKDIPLQAATELFPDVDEYDLHAQWAEDQAADAHSPHNARLAPYYRIDQADQIDRDQVMVRMVEVEWWQFEPAWRTLDPATGRWILLDDIQAALYRIRNQMLGRPIYMSRDKRKRYYKAICGNRVLKLAKGMDKGGFSYKFITGKRDVTKGTWYGIVRAMLDPQMWANKWLSQGLHIVNTNAKGGLLAESDAFVDFEEARDSWAEADTITELNPGGLNKIQQKNPPQFPPQLNAFMSMAMEAIPQVSGVNMELMGQSTTQAPQVALLEAGRRQQAMNVLAGLFNAKRRYHKEQGRLLLYMILEFISDGRLIRVGGVEEARYVPLIHEPGTVEYDVIVDEAPTSPNMKERVWAALMQMFPLLRGMAIPPQFYVSALKYAPIPASAVEEMQSILSQPQPPNAAMQSKAAVDQATAQLRQAQAMKATAEAQAMPAKVAMENESTEAAIDLRRAQTANQYQNAGLSTWQAMQSAAHAAHERAMDVVGHMHTVGQAAGAGAMPPANVDATNTAPVGGV